MIFTGQVWNMVFAFYHSLKSVPRDLTDVVELSKLSSWQRFSRLDLPFATHGLVWNSMLSMAGGWFFLTVSEAFVLGQHDFRLPGVGSYMSVAIEKGNVSAQICGILAMAGMILLLDQLVWRPLVSWSVKFSPEEVVAQRTGNSWLWTRIQRSHLFRNLAWIKGRLAWPRKSRSDVSLDSAGSAWGWNRTMLRWMIRGLIAMVAVTCSYGVIKYVQLLRTLDAQEWQRIAMSGLLTFTRVAVAVLVASIWTIPAGVAIGRSPRWRVALQPVIQVMASFPAPMIFPLALGLLFSMGLGLGVGSMVLLVLAIQWYILFNVVAGVGQIAPELWEVARLTRLSRQQQWRKLILPGIFPFLLVGWMTAMGGAWNASIVAELVHYNGKTMMTTGLGALISEATSQGRFPLLAAAVGTMAVVVVAFNRLVWHPLSRQAQTRFQAEA
jgi:NitT/TauT family transport system permease protein